LRADLRSEPGYSTVVDPASRAGCRRALRSWLLSANETRIETQGQVEQSHER